MTLREQLESSELSQWQFYHPNFGWLDCKPCDASTVCNLEKPWPIRLISSEETEE